MQIYIWNQLTRNEQREILERPSLFYADDIKNKTQKIIDQVKTNGDKAVIELTAKYDQCILNELRVTESEFEAAQTQITSEALTAIKFAYEQITRCHSLQLPRSSKIETYPGIFCERQVRPIDRVGLYVPGGSAPLISTLLMLAIPTKIANCPLRILCTPANKNGTVDPHLLVAAKLCDIETVYKVGGAQAIASMAYGTESIPKIDKIFGPGNTWVTTAKILVSQDPAGTSIDMPAGPSEVFVIADDFANPRYVASDLLSQAEHGTDSQVILIAFSEAFALSVQEEIKSQSAFLSRRNIIEKSLMNSRIIIVENMQQAFNISNRYAPEHLILHIEQPEQYIETIQNAGAVFLGPWSAETMGDYITGSNHVLPTNGYARSCSGLSVTDFMKCINFQKVTSEGIKKIGNFAEKLAEIEGLSAHKQAVSLRLADLMEEKIV